MSSVPNDSSADEFEAASVDDVLAALRRISLTCPRFPSPTREMAAVWHYLLADLPVEYCQEDLLAAVNRIVLVNTLPALADLRFAVQEIASARLWGER